MTEPMPGAGSDPDLLSTRATKTPRGWRIDGRKWFITGACGAELVICMARTSGEPGRPGGATMFLVVANPGVTIVRGIQASEAFFGGHCEIVFENCLVDQADVLGAVDEGFEQYDESRRPAGTAYC